MKIKVGDWVKIACLDNTVAKVTQIDERGMHVYIGKLMQNLYTGDFIKCLTKLPIKFKPFQIKQGEEDVAYIIEETRVLHKNTRAIKFKAVQIHEGGLCEVILHTDGKTQTRWEKNSKTIEQAKDWLELQYATMIAKARGLE